MHVESRCLKQKEKYQILCCFDLIEQRHKAKIIVPDTFRLSHKKYAHFVSYFLQRNITRAIRFEYIEKFKTLPIF